MGKRRRESDTVAPKNLEEPIVGQKLSILSRLNTILRRLLHRAEVDRGVVLGVLTRIWSLLSSPVTMLLIASYFTPELQGYYYTFSSLLALQVFVELGLGQVIIQFASHEWSKLGFDKEGRVVGDPIALSRLVSLGQIVFRWYIAAGVISAVGLGASGYVFFSQTPHKGIYWTGPWLALCALTGMNLFLLPLWSLLEGCNQVSRVYAFRLIQGVLRSLSAWPAIVLGAGLWTPTAVTAVGLIWGVIFLRLRYWRFWLSFFSVRISARIHWRLEIWPLQWKIALSWLSGYFTFSLFTPILFHYHGPVVAGQMGMTWGLVSALSAISSTWVLTKAPRFGMLIAKKEYKTLDRLFFRVAVASFSVGCCGAIAIFGMVYLLYSFNHPLSARLLPPLPTGLFLIATVLMQISYPQSTYLRAHKREPFLVLSVVGGTLMALSTWQLGSRFAATGAAAGYLAVRALFSIPLGTVIWCRCRSLWHSGEMGQAVTSNLKQGGS